MPVLPGLAGRSAVGGAGRDVDTVVVETSVAAQAAHLPRLGDGPVGEEFLLAEGGVGAGHRKTLCPGGPILPECQRFHRSAMVR
jgi:hypothetical protein